MEITIIALFLSFIIAVLVSFMIAFISHKLSCKHTFVSLDNDSTLGMWQCVHCDKTTYDLEEVWTYNVRE